MEENFAWFPLNFAKLHPILQTFWEIYVFRYNFQVCPRKNVLAGTPKPLGVRVKTYMLRDRVTLF